MLLGVLHRVRVEEYEKELEENYIELEKYNIKLEEYDMELKKDDMKIKEYDKLCVINIFGISVYPSLI